MYANLKEIRIDTTVFLFTLAVSLGTGILFGLTPALKAARTDVQQSLRDGGRSVASGHSFTRNALVVAEVALSMVLLVGAGLLIRSFARLANVSPGFDALHVLSMQLAEAGRFPTDEKWWLSTHKFSSVSARFRAWRPQAPATSCHWDSADPQPASGAPINLGPLTARNPLLKCWSCCLGTLPR